MIINSGYIISGGDDFTLRFYKTSTYEKLNPYELDFSISSISILNTNNNETKIVIGGDKYKD